MSFDGIFLNSVKDELYDKLMGGRVDKIYQPDKNEIIAAIRSNGENYRLLMTTISSSPRLQLTNEARKNPEQPPMFCMLLRKHLTGAHIRDIRQINSDRIIEIIFECRDELETVVSKSLIMEIMGKHSNLILADTESRVIIDSIKRVTENVSSLRQVYPGLKYILPPLPEKVNPFTVARDEFFNVLKSTNEGIRVFDFIYKTFTGISPFISKEICFISGIDEGAYTGELNDSSREALWNSFSKVMDTVRKKDYSFNTYYSEELKINDFYCIDLQYLREWKSGSFTCAGDLLDTFYYEIDNKNKINQKISGLLKNITTKLDRTRKKTEKQRNELLNAEDREKYKIYGELILANLHKIPENHSLTVLNYYDPEQREITIPLDPKLNLKLNSQKFFKKYNKLKNAEEELMKFIDEGEKEAAYLENILFSIEECTTTDDLEDIYVELVNEGFMKRKSRVKKQKEYKPEVLTYVSSGGHHILVGRNNLQNEYITFKLGKKEDYWFHAKNIPGSHVIVKTNGDELTDQEYVEAAGIAAYYSKAKGSGMVEVDYTRRSNIRKPPAAKAGFVIYDTNYSMLVKPRIEGIETI